MSPCKVSGENVTLKAQMKMAHMTGTMEPKGGDSIEKGGINSGRELYIQSNQSSSGREILKAAGERGSQYEINEQNIDLCVEKMYKNTIIRVYCMNIVHNRFKTEKKPHINRDFAH